MVVMAVMVVTIVVSVPVGVVSGVVTVPSANYILYRLYL